MNPILRKGLRNNYLAPFLAIIMLLSFCKGYAQTYNPSQHVVINSAMGEAQAAPVDARSMFFDANLFLYRPYQSQSEVYSYLNAAKYRTGNFLIVIDSGGILQPNGTFLNGVNTIWMFKDSTGNANLVKLNLFGSNGCTGCLLVANNLSDLQSITTAKTNLALNNVDNTSDLTKWAATATLTNKTISGLSNTFSNIPVSALAQNSIGLTITQNPAANISVTSTPATLGGALIFNVPTASATQRGALQASDFSFFRSKLDSVHFSGDTLYNCANGVCNVIGVVTGGGGGSGTVLNFSSGNLTGFFTTSVATASTTPNQTFTFVNAPGRSVWGDSASSSGTPFYFVPNSAILADWFGGALQGALTLTTTGTSGAATLIGNILNIPNYSAGGGSTNTNIGSGYRWAVPGSNNIKTAFGSLIIIDSTTNTNALTFTADTTSGATKLATQGFVSRSYQPIGNYVTGGTGDVVFTGPGTVPATIQANAVTTTKIINNAVTLAKMATNTVNSLLGYDGSGNAADITLSTSASTGSSSISATVLSIPTYTLQGVITDGATLNTTNTVTNTGQSFTWLNAGSGLFKWSGLSHDTTNTVGPYVSYTDSSMRMIPWANFALKLSPYMPVFNLFPRQGLSPLGTSNDSLQLGGVIGTFFQPDTIFTAGQPFYITGLPNKSTLLSTDSISILTLTNQWYKVPVSALGSGGTITGAGNFSPLFNTSVTGGNTITFTAINASANTVFGNFTGSPAAAAFGKVNLASMATNTANSLLGYDGSGNATDVTAGSNISISAGVISATGIPAVPSAGLVASNGSIFTNALSSLNTQIINNGGQTYVSATSLLPTDHHFYLANTGQSNAGFRASAISQSDTVSDPRVKIFNRATNTFVKAVPGQAPFPAASGGNIGCNTAWYLAKYIAAATGDTVMILNYYHDSQPISSWWTGSAIGPDLDSLYVYATAAAWPRTDLFLWDQGENNDATGWSPGNTSGYILSFDSVMGNLRRQTWFAPMTPTLVVGMPQVYQGSITNFQYADTVLKIIGSGRDRWTQYAPTDSAQVNSGDIHFSNAGKKTIAFYALQKYGLIPWAKPTVFNQMNYLLLKHKDSLPYGGAQSWALTLQNMSGHGATGIAMLDSTGTISFRLLTQNGTTSVSGVYTAGANILSSENSKNLEVWTAFVKRAKFSSTGLDVAGAVTQTQTSSALYNAYEWFGENNANTWLLGGAGSTYSNAPVAPGTFTLYNLTNGPQWNISQLGLMRVGHNVQSSQARLTIDGAVTAANNNTLGMVFSAVKGVITENTLNNQKVNHISLYGLAADTLYFASGNDTAVNASSLYIEGAPVQQTSHTLINKPWALYIKSGNSTTLGHYFINDTTDRSTSFQLNGGMWMNKDSAITSSAGSVMALGIDTSTGRVVKLSGGAGGTPTWQQVLTAGSTFTGNNSVTMAGNTFSMTGGDVGLGTSATSTAALTVGIANFNSSYGTGLVTVGGTSNDPITAASGSQTIMAANRFKVPTFTATNASVTYTNAATVYIDGAPTAGSNVTETNKFPLYVDGASPSYFVGPIIPLHIGGNSSTPTTNTLGTNVTSATVTGNDNHFKIVLVTSGAIAGSLCTVNFGSTWSSTPICVISSADANTGGSIATTVGGYVAFSGVSTTQGQLAGAITAAGTYTFNIICGN